MKNKDNNKSDHKVIEKIEEDSQSVNPFIDKGNYLIQVVDEGQVIKEVLAINSIVKIANIGEQGAAAVLK